MKIPKVAKPLLGVAIAGAGLWYFFRGVDTSQLLSEIRKISPWALIAAGSLSVVSIYLRAMRWQLVLPRTLPTRTGDLFSITMIGYMLNNVFPARAGEAARAVLLWRKCRCRPFVGIGSLFVERFIDIQIFSLFFFAPVFLIPSLRIPMLLGPAKVLAAVFCGSVLAFSAYGLFPARCRGLARKLLTIMPRFLHARILRIGREFTTNLDWLFDPKRLGKILLLSVVTLLCYTGCILALVGDPSRFGLLPGLFVIACAALGAAIPLAPGYVGTLHALMLQGLVLTGIVEDRARALALLYHACGYVPVTLLGIYYYFRLDVRFKEISQEAEATRRSTRDDLPVQPAE